MKVYKKCLRKISVDDQIFIWTVTETKEYMKIRCYSLKSTYIEVIFDWGKLLCVLNLYDPYVVEAIIKHAIQLGWNYQVKNQIISISPTESEEWIKETNWDRLKVK